MLYSARVFLIVCGWCVVAAQAKAADSLEDGVAELAQQIVSKSAATQRKTIAVASFPHADDTCSELSNYMVDELVLSLFDVSSGEIQIVERSQLERIFAELALSLSGAVDANSTKELGRIYGVDALVIGSITVLGDRLRVISRMIDTETGQVFSAAATKLPKTATIAALMERPASGGCTRTPTAGSADDDQPSRQIATEDAQDREPTARSAVGSWADRPSQLVAGLKTTALSASVAKNDKYAYVNVSVTIENVSNDDIRLALIGPPPQVNDNAGNNYEFWKFSGATMCSQLGNNYVESCLANSNYTIKPNAYTMIPKNSYIVTNYIFWSDLKKISGDIGSEIFLSSNFAQLIVKNENEGEKGYVLRSINVGIPGINVNSK